MQTYSFGLVSHCGLLFLAAGASIGLLSHVDALFSLVLGVLTLWLTKSDLEGFQLPDLGNLAVAILGIAWISLRANGEASLADGALRMIVAGASLSAVKVGYAKLRGVEGLGWGDVKLAAAGAIWLEWPQLPITLFIAAAAGIVAVTVRASILRTAIRGSAIIPFGAFLAPSIWAVWFAGRAGLS